MTECVRLSCEGGGYKSEDPLGVLVHNSTSGILSISYRDETRGVCQD